MKKFILILLVLALSLFSLTALAEETKEAKFDFLTFAKENVLTDFHPTAKPENATTEYSIEPKTDEEGIVTATVTVFYSGWVKKHQATYAIDLMPEAGLVRVNVLEDTNGMNKIGNKLFRPDAWIELSSLGLNAAEFVKEKEAAEETETTAKTDDDFDFLTFAKEKMLPDFHPTAKPEEAKADYDKTPAKNDNGIITARVRVWYTSLKLENDMLANVEFMPKARLIKVDVLRDSDVLNLTGNKIFKPNTWIELASLDL